jgi:hypothetical protein
VDEKSIPPCKIDMSWAMGYSIPDLDPTPFLELILSSMTEGFASDVQFGHPVTHSGHYFVIYMSSLLV